MPKLSGLVGRAAKHAPARRAERKLLHRLARVVLLQRELDLGKHQIWIGMERAQERDGRPVRVAKQSVEKMFGADEIVLPAFRLTKRPLHDAPSAGGEAGEHFKRFLMKASQLIEFAAKLSSVQSNSAGSNSISLQFSNALLICPRSLPKIVP